MSTRGLRRFAGVSLAAAALSAAAFSTSAAELPSTADQPSHGGTLVIGETTQPVSGLDPILAQAFNSKRMVSQFYEGLLALGTEPGELVAGLATDWEQLSDTEYRFTLRDGVTFHDGTALTADDVVYSLQRVIDPANRSPYQPLYDIATIVADDDSTITVTTNGPQASLLALLAQPWSAPIMSQAWTEARTDEELMTQENGTGPFKLDGYEAGSVIRTVRFDDYWDQPKPYLDAVDFRVIPEESTLVQALSSGSVQMGQVGIYSSVEVLEGRGLVIGPSYPIGTQWTGLDTLEGPLADVNVRRAVSLGIDREQLIQIASEGTGVLASVIPPADPLGCVMTEDSPYYRRDVDQARALLAEAGATDVKLTLRIQSDAGQQLQSAQLMKQQLEDIGVELDIVLTPFAEIVDSVVGGVWNGEMLALTSVLNADASQYLALWFAPGSPNTKVEDPQLDEMMAAAMTVGSTEERRAAYQEICDHIAEHVYQIVPYASPFAWDVWNDDVKGFFADPTQTRLFLKDAWLG